MKKETLKSVWEGRSNHVKYTQVHKKQSNRTSPFFKVGLKKGKVQHGVN